MKLFETIKSHRWDLGLACCGNPGEVMCEDLDWMPVKNPDKSRWFADPQILSVSDDAVVLLVEEFTYSRNIGRIAQIKIDRKSLTICDVQIILELPTHLSFPSILRTQTGIMVHPENSQTGGHYIYDYDENRLHSPRLVVNLPLTDAVMLDCCGEQLMFSTSLPNPNGSVLDIFKSKGDIWEKIQTVDFEDNVARSAGDFLEFEGKIIRPAQICNKLYGEGICFQELVKGKDGSYDFKEIKRIYPPAPYDGMHTFNYMDGVAVTDFRCYNYPLIHSIFSGIKHFGWR